MPRTLSNQQLMFYDVQWDENIVPYAAPTLNSPQPVTGRPPGTESGQPYWEFQWQLTEQSGIHITNVDVRDTQIVAGSSVPTCEPVCESIDFTDLKFALDNTPVGSFVDFDVAAGFAHPDARFQMYRKGTRIPENSRTPDPLFQYGLCLRLFNDFEGLRIRLELAVVFRGANNDFDPGGIPFALEIFPQIGWTWEPISSSRRRVRQFRGSVRVTVNNHMSLGAHAAHAPHENIASLFTDSNISFENISRAHALMSTHPSRALASYFSGNPIGWMMLFDYTQTNLTTEKEYPVVYGPLDGNGFTHLRQRTYYWPSGTMTSGNSVQIGGFQVAKLPRQGYYDNIHLHAKMHRPDSRGNLQIHAPFCGHSCVHMHWRWSSFSSNGAVDGRGWQYRGWSFLLPEAYSESGSPLIPPNQKLTVAICQPSRTRYSDTEILPPGGGGDLDVLYKMIWYCADIFHSPRYPLNAREQQVIMENGLGWAYRYSTPQENSAIGGLALGISPGRHWHSGSPTIHQDIADFFESDVYPFFRYYDATGIVVDQVPNGSYDNVDSGGSDVRMEEL